MKSVSFHRFVRSTVVASLVAAGTASVVVGAAPVGAAAGDLLFTHYIEGSGNNKAVEIANTSGGDIDLSDYTIERYTNGSPTVSATIELGGTLTDGEVFVVANPSAVQDILDVADLETGNANWNGDDAIVLREVSSDLVIDSFGQVGVDPGSSWENNGISSQNDSLCRSSDVATGDAVPDDAFDPSIEWESKGIDNIDGLGVPGCELEQVGDLLFTQYVEGSSSNKAIEIFNGTGVDISLDGYSLELYSNGSPTASTTSDLTGLGSIADGDVFVLSNSSANADIQAVSDANVSAVNWNGDDAIVLQGPSGVADSFGQVGTDPGSAWSANGVSTQNDTLCRLDSVTAGDVVIDDAFDPSLEWESKGNDNIDGLGDAGCNPPPEAGSVIITQYVEGSSNNKAIEIGNLGSTSADISGYTIERYSNGAPTFSGTIPLSGTLDPGAVFVVANPSANADILAVADDTNGSVNWNGDDALVLRDGDGNVADSFGQVGVDPGDEWGTSDLGTQNDTLCRRPEVTAGDVVIDDVFDPAVEWIGKGEDNIDGLGSIGCDLQAVGDLIFTQYVEGSSNNKAIEIANFTGAPLDLGGYGVEIYFNGSPTVSSTITPTAGVLADGDVFVIANSSSNAAILSVADQATGSANWNGDDAIVLRNIGDGTVADSIGQVGVDPGDEWGDATIGTQNDTLCRNADIGSTNADTDPTDVFDPSLQWSSLGNDNILGLGEVGCIDTSAGECGTGGTTLISAVQGNGAASPIVGSTVVVEGIVVGDYQTPAQFNGFYLQEEDADVDADPNTSEGIFVFDTSVDVAEGDRVRVRGTVDEFFDATQIDDVSDVIICDDGVGAEATPVSLTLPYAEGFDFETIEGMAVDITGSLVVTDTFNTARFGEIRISVDEPLLNPTQAAEPGPEANAVAALNDRSQVLLDDGRSGAELADVAYFGSDGTLRRGDSFEGTLQTVLSFNFGAYKFQPRFDATVPDIFTRVDERELSPPDVGGDITVASFNVLNYFTTLDERGADTTEELTRQRDKIVAAVTQIDADVIGLIEVENNTAAIADLVDGFNEVAGAGTYAFLDTGSIGTDAIKVGFVYKPANVSPVGAFAILDSSVDPRFIDTKNRPALIQTFEAVGSGGVVTVAINHFKSKGSDCDELGDPDVGDEQGNCNLTRTAAATALVDYLATDPTGSGSDNFLILGDINAYPNEDPIDAFEAGGYVDLLTQFAPEAQSFVFFGEGGRLDHALASPALLDSITGADEWSINAAEPRGLDYNVGGADGDNPPGLYQPDPFRSSDHDPVIVGLSFAQPAKSALFVVGRIVGNDNLFRGDQALLDIIEELGVEVTVIEDDDVVPGVEEGNDLVVISSSVNSRKVGDAFTDSAVPVASAEGYLFDDLGFNRRGFFRNGVTLFRYTDFEIVDADQPMAGGITGTPDVVTQRSRFAYSRPEGDVQVVGERGSLAVLFGYEDGAQMSGDFTAPARRVGLFSDYRASTRLTGDGEDLVAAALLWALGD